MNKQQIKDLAKAIIDQSEELSASKPFITSTQKELSCIFSFGHKQGTVIDIDTLPKYDNVKYSVFKGPYEYIQPGISTGVLVVISGIPEKKKPRNKGIW